MRNAKLRFRKFYFNKLQKRQTDEKYN